MYLKALIPKEHGAWAILILPYFVGVAIGEGLSGRNILGLFGTLLIFLSRQPLLILVKRRLSGHKSLKYPENELWRNFFFLSGGGAAIFLWLFVQYRLGDLIILGLMAMFLSFIHTCLVLYQKERTVIGEVLGVVILTLSAPAGFVLSGGELAKEAFILWFLNAFYFSGSIFYIKMRKKAILSRSELNFPKNINLVKECLAFISILVLIVVILVFIKIMHVLVFLAFVPMVTHTLRSIFLLRPKFEIMKQGLIQTALSLMFAVLTVIFWR